MSNKGAGLTVRPWVLSLVVVVVTVVWAASILAGLVIDSWESDAGVNAVMGALLALIGSIAGKSLFARPSQDEGPPREVPRDES